jgi:signal peptidase I
LNATPVLPLQYGVKPDKSLPRLRWFWREWLKPCLAILLITGAARSSLADWNDVPTGSMKPTIMEGDRVWVNKLAYDLKVPFTLWRLAQWSEPQRGDIVVFFSPHDGERLVKRVVGLPGDSIELRNNLLRVNGELLEYSPLPTIISQEIPEKEQPTHEFATEDLRGRKHAVMTTLGRPAARQFGPSTVPAGHYFMMGDNRDNSFDSRYFGSVERRRIVGRATDVVLSFDRAKRFTPRWHRFFTDLP